MEWFKKTSPTIVDTQLGALSLDIVLVRKDYPYMFVVENENHNYYAFWETEHTACYEQWYVTRIPKWLRDKVNECNNCIDQIWDWDRRYDQLSSDPEFYYMRHWFETDRVYVWETADGAPDMLYDSAYGY